MDFIASNIRKNVEQHRFTLSSGTKINISVSIGVSSYPEHTADKIRRTGRYSFVQLNYED